MSIFLQLFWMVAACTVISIVGFFAEVKKFGILKNIIRGTIFFGATIIMWLLWYQIYIDEGNPNIVVKFPLPSPEVICKVK